MVASTNCYCLLPLGFGIFNIIGFNVKQEKLMILQGDTRVGDSERNGPRRIQPQFMQPEGNDYPHFLKRNKQFKF